MTEILLEQNQQWKAAMDQQYPDFFQNSASEPQRPTAIWVGCSDSRVPEGVVTASLPGVIFAQRNIANQFSLTDDNAMSALEYAVEHLNVNHVIICGHSKCGGCIAALEAAIQPPTYPKNAVDRWIAPIVELARQMGLYENNDENLEKLVQANIVAQVEKIAKSDVIREAWAHQRELYIHGWEYGLADGLLNDLNVTIGPDTSAGAFPK